MLEVGCGTGMGLGYLAETASSVVGGDYTFSLLEVAQSTYRGQMPLLRLDAQDLPFANGAFDLVVMFEAIYYLHNAQQFITEARRVLSPGGVLLVSTVNKDWDEFAPSAFSTKYYSTPQLRDMLLKEGFDEIQAYGGFPIAVRGPKHRAVSLIRRLVVALNLMPKTLKGRAHFKRLFYGRLAPLPTQLKEGMTELFPLESVDADKPNHRFKILYCVAHRIG